MTFKEAILRLHEQAGELAQAAGLLENKNLADILAASAAKLVQASEHPDVGMVDELASKHMEAAQAPATPPPFDLSKAQQ